MTTNKLFNQSIQEMRTLITNAVEQEEIRAKILPHGYTDEKMLELQNLLAETEQSAFTQEEEYLQKKHASDTYMHSYMVVGKNYAQLRKVCKYKLSSTSPDWIDLELSSPVPRTYAAEIAFYQKFYTRLLIKATLITDLAPFGITTESITAEQAQVAALKGLFDIREKETGEAQRATKLRDDKYIQLKNECSDLRRLLKIVFEGSEAQLLESLGILVRS